jgi:hypothetical protein
MDGLLDMYILKFKAHMKLSMTGQEKDGVLIQVAA